MTPEQISEFEKRMHEEDANCGLAREILDALEAAQQEIADLKRGGVVVPAEVPEEALDFIADDVRFRWDPWDEEHDMAVKLYHEWLLNHICAIPADRVLGEGEERIRWISVDEAIPRDRQNIGFIVSCGRDDFLHGRVYGGNFNARDFENRFGGFQTHGFSCMASHWFPFPPVPEALRAQPTQEPTP